MPETRLLVNFARFGSKTEFLIKFLDDSAWFCVEKLTKHSFVKDFVNRIKVKKYARNKKYIKIIVRVLLG